MGKKGGSSWLTAVKRAFRSPAKDADKRNTRKKEDYDQEEDEENKREKRRWIFRKPTTQESATQQRPVKAGAAEVAGAAEHAAAADQRHAIAMAVATAAAAEAAVATAHAAMEVARLTKPSSYSSPREQYAAVLIQTAFRGYLARRALRALKGLVKLQALVRGHNVRKQAKMTLRCMQSLVRVQARVLDQRLRLSHDGSSRKSTFSNTNSMWESRYLQDISDRKSVSRERSSMPDDWDERPHTIEEVKAMLQHRKEAALKREKIFSQALSQQSRRHSTRSPSMGGEADEDRPKWLNQWMAAGNRRRASTDQREHIKTVEMDTSSQPYSYLAPNYRRANTNTSNGSHHHNQSQRPSSPLQRSQQSQPHNHHSPASPSPAKSRPIQVRSASPRCHRDDRSYTSSQTPSLRSNYFYTGGRGSTTGSNAGSAALPNYMAATESAKARIRSQSAPRQRPSTPERERNGSARKRLSFPVPEAYGAGAGFGQNLRSPSFKSVSGYHFGLEQQSNYSSCCTESLAGEISPSSTSDLRRWLR